MSVARKKGNGSPEAVKQVSPHIEAGAGDNLEGVISLPNDTNQWGPWAGKILTGDENTGIFYTIDTNGAVTPYDLRIASDHFALVQTNQDLYLCDYSNNRILKLSRDILNNYVGDMLITEEQISPALYIVNWNGTNFISRVIDLSQYTSEPEDAAFAPLNLPSQPCHETYAKLPIHCGQCRDTHPSCYQRASTELVCSRRS